MFISPTAAADYNERFRDMYTFSELIWNIRKVGKIDSRKMQGQSAFTEYRIANQNLKSKINMNFVVKHHFWVCKVRYRFVPKSAQVQRTF